jgi:Tfp pilus assembly protein PilO
MNAVENFAIALISAIIPTIASVATILSQNSKNNALQDERDKNLKEEIEKLSTKVEAHNNFGLQLAELKTRVDLLERNTR